MFIFYVKTLKPQFQNPKFYSPISLLHNFTSKKRLTSNPAVEFILNETQAFQSQNTSFSFPAPIEEKFLPQEKIGDLTKTQISHPWREWVDLMHKLIQNGYFEAIGNPFANSGELGNKEANLIRTACLNFARDQYQLIRYLSRKDILVIAGAGCPSTDRKVVNSGKRLRAHVGSNEGNVCSCCDLRGDCDRAYIEARENEGGRTVDVMRFLLIYGLNPVINAVNNRPCLNKKVEESVRKLLREMVDIKVVEGHDHKLPRATASHQNSPTEETYVDIERSQIHAPMKQGDWICSKCNFLNFARNIKCLRCDGIFAERIRKIAEEQDHLPLKKGDWICDKCNFLNFARNTRCLQCKEKPPKRQLNPGEWECESCNYINFRRNMICLKCDHKRPIASSLTDNVSQHVSNTINNHQMQPWFRQEKRVSDEGGGISLEFVKNKDVDQSSCDQTPGLMEFPVVGGKSSMSLDIQKRELWVMEMANHSGNAVCAREGPDRFNSSPFLERSEYLVSGGKGDDEMAEWFGSAKKT